MWNFLNLFSCFHPLVGSCNKEWLRYVCLCVSRCVCFSVGWFCTEASTEALSGAYDNQHAILHSKSELFVLLVGKSKNYTLLHLHGRNIMMCIMITSVTLWPPLSLYHGTCYWMRYFRQQVNILFSKLMTGPCGPCVPIQSMVDGDGLISFFSFFFNLLTQRFLRHS